MSVVTAVNRSMLPRADERHAYLPASASVRQIAETLAAFANTRGGRLVLGVDRQQQVVGIENPQALIERLLDAAWRIEPPLTRSIPFPHIESLAGKTVVVVEVPAGLSHVYRFEGRFYGRRGASNEPLDAEALRQLLLTRGDVTFESLPARGATLDDLDMQAVQAYASRVERFVGLSPLDVLRRRGCVTPDDEPTYAGLLLFGHTPQRFLPSAQIVLARYPGREMGDRFLRDVAEGTLPQQILQAEAFLVDNMRRGAVMRGLVREEQTEYPIEAVREAIVNAVAHRDYSIRGAEIRIFMFADRIEVISPGRLPGHVTVQNLLHERFSRNEIIVQVLSDMGFIERLGYGIDRIVRVMAQAGLPAPRFEETANGFKLTLFGHGERMLSTDRESASRWAHLGLNERQIRALEFVAEKGRITNREYQQLVPNVSSETLRRDLAQLVEMGVLIKVGEKRGTYYIFK
nr:helix-turn-helix domain-containing protein [Ardenticatena sp.]